MQRPKLLGERGAWQSMGDQTVIGAGEFNTTVIKLWIKAGEAHKSEAG